MKKIKLVSILGIGMVAVVSLTGCGTSKNEEKNITSNNIIEQNTLEEREIRKNEKQSSDNRVEVNEFVLAYEGVNIIPGALFDERSIEEKAQVTEVPSKAFINNDKVYTYDNVEITVANIEGEDRIYAVRFLDDKIATTEDVRITDTKQDMINTYGENYVQTEENKCTYTIEKIELSFTIEKDSITAIEYTLKTN